MDFISLYEDSGNRIHGRIVNYSAAVITTNHHITAFHRYMRGFLSTGALLTLTKLCVKVKVKVKVCLYTAMKAHQVHV
jgi:hypothetical protein